MIIEIKKPKGLILKVKDTLCDEDIVVVPALQKKEVTVADNTTVKPENGFAGLSEVVITVNKAPECDHPECEHENLTCNLDFSGSEDGDIVGEMVFSAPTNAAYNKVFINKPDALIPENISEGIKIAGVVGTLKTESKYSYAEGVTF